MSKEKVIQFVETQLLTGELSADYDMVQVSKGWFVLTDGKGRTKGIVAVFVTVEEEEEGC